MRKKSKSVRPINHKIPPSHVFGFSKQIISGLYVLFLILFISFSLIGKVGFFPNSQWIQMRTVISGSMEPTIPIGSLIVSKEVPVNKLQVGDIVSFESNGEIVTHRIAKIEDKKIYTKGDANESLDEGYAEEIIGKVILHIPKIGVFFQIIQTTRGSVALVLTIVTFILLERFIRLLWQTEYKQQGEFR